MKMRAKKKLSTEKEPIRRSEPLVSIPPWRYKVVVHRTSNLGATKSWLRETTARCSGSRDHLRSLMLPQLHRLDDSPYHASEYDHNCTVVPVVDVLISRMFPCSNKAKIPSKFGRPISSDDDDDDIVEYSSSSSVIPDLQLTGFASPSLNAYCLNPSKEGKEYSYERTLINYRCSIIDPFDAKKRSLQFTSLLYFRGVLLALSLQGALAVIQETGPPNLTIAAISSFRAVPSVSSRYFKEYLFALDGEIMLVFLIHEKSVRVVDEVEVFRLCFPDLKWVKVERIQGNKTVFLDQCNLEVHSAENGARRNCIYFTDQGSDDEWWIYDMETRCISPA